MCSCGLRKWIGNNFRGNFVFSSFFLILSAYLEPVQAQEYLWTVGDGGHSATFFDENSILLTGGQDGFDAILDTAQHYNATLELLSNLNALNEPRAYHGAVRLFDGRVMLVGGTDGVHSLDSIEIFDPATGSFFTSAIPCSSREKNRL